MAFQQIINQPRYAYYGYYGRNNNLFNDIINYENLVGSENVTQVDKDLLIEWYTSQGTKSIAYQLKSEDKLLVNKYIIKNYNINKKQFLKFIKCTSYNEDKEWISDWLALNPNVQFTESEKKKIANINFVNTSIDENDITQSLFEEFFGNENFIKKNIGLVEIEEVPRPRYHYGSSLYYVKNMFHESDKKSINDYLDSLNNSKIKNFLNKGLIINENCIFNLNSKTNFKFQELCVYYIRIICLQNNINLAFTNINGSSSSLSNFFNIQYFDENVKIESILNYDIIEVILKNQFENKYLNTDLIYNSIINYFNNITGRITGIEFVLYCIKKLIYSWHNVNQIKTTKNNFYSLIIGFNKNLYSDTQFTLNLIKFYNDIIKSFKITLDKDIMLASVKNNCEPMFLICKDKGLLFNGLLKYAMLNNNKNIILELINNKIVPTPQDFRFLGLSTSSDIINTLKAIHNTDLYYMDSETVLYLKNITNDLNTINTLFSIYYDDSSSKTVKNYSNINNENFITKDYDTKKIIIKKIIFDKSYSKLISLIKFWDTFDYSLIDINDIISITDNYLRVFLYDKKTNLKNT